MKKLRRFLALVLCAALCFLLMAGCGSRNAIRFKMIAELNQEEFCIAFRKDDPLCDIFTAALKELSADGQISRLSAQYLGTDYSCMEALPGALLLLETQPEPGRKLRVLEFPRAALVVHKQTRYADLSLGGKLFKRYYVTTKSGCAPGAYPITSKSDEGPRSRFAALGIRIAPVDLLELDMFLAPGSLLTVSEM